MASKHLWITKWSLPIINPSVAQSLTTESSMSVDLHKLPPSGSLILVSIVLDYSQRYLSLRQKTFLNHHRDDLDADVVWTLLRYLLCVDRFDQFRPPWAILVNLEEGGTFAWVLLRLNVIFWWYLKTMIIRFKSAREITNKVTDNKILLQIAFQVLLKFLPVRTRRGSISIWWQPCLN